MHRVEIHCFMFAFLKLLTWTLGFTVNQQLAPNPHSNISLTRHKGSASSSWRSQWEGILKFFPNQWSLSWYGPSSCMSGTPSSKYIVCLYVYLYLIWGYIRTLYYIFRLNVLHNYTNDIYFMKYITRVWSNPATTLNHSFRKITSHAKSTATRCCAALFLWPLPRFCT